MISKDSLYILLIFTIFFNLVLLHVPVWTTMGRATHPVITLLFVITIRVSVKEGDKLFLNLVKSLLG